MRFSDLFKSKTSDPKKLIERDCKKWLREANGMFALRRTVDEREFAKIEVPKNRTPRDSHIGFHTSLVKAFNNLGFKANRHNSLFTGTETFVPSVSYGSNLVAVFPIGNYSYTWAPGVVDLTTKIFDLDLELVKPKTESYTYVSTFTDPNKPFNPKPLIDLISQMTGVNSDKWKVQQKRRTKNAMKTDVYTTIPFKKYKHNDILYAWIDMVEGSKELSNVYNGQASLRFNEFIPSSSYDIKRIEERLKSLGYRKDGLQAALHDRVEIMISCDHAYILEINKAKDLFGR